MFIDIKPEPTDSLEVFQRWVNHQTSLFISSSIFSRKIKVIYD